MHPCTSISLIYVSMHTALYVAYTCVRVYTRVTTCSTRTFSKGQMQDGHACAYIFQIMKYTNHCSAYPPGHVHVCCWEMETVVLKTKTMMATRCVCRSPNELQAFKIERRLIFRSLDLYSRLREARRLPQAPISRQLPRIHRSTLCWCCAHSKEDKLGSGSVASTGGRHG